MLAEDRHYDDLPKSHLNVNAHSTEDRDVIQIWVVRQRIIELREIRKLTGPTNKCVKRGISEITIAHRFMKTPVIHN